MTSPVVEGAASTRRPRHPGLDQPLHEWLVPAVIFAFCAIAAWLTTTFDEAPAIIVGDAMQPRNFPLFLCALIAIFNVALVVQMLRHPVMERNRQPVQTLATGILIALFYPGAEYVDMFLTLGVIMFCMCIVWGERRLWVAALVGLFTPAVIFFTFDLLLDVRFPRGLLTNIYYG